MVCVPLPRKRKSLISTVLLLVNVAPVKSKRLLPAPPIKPLLVTVPDANAQLETSVAPPAIVIDPLKLLGDNPTLLRHAFVSVAPSRLSLTTAYTCSRLTTN